MALIDKLTNLANAIRAKTGKTESLTLDQMVEEVEGISAGGEDTLKKLLDTTHSASNLFNNYYPYDDVSDLISFEHTSSVTTMRSMFCQCSQLITIPLLDTRLVTDMGSMFIYCYQLRSVPPLDMRSATNVGSMFYECRNLTECWIRNIKTSIIVGSGNSYGHLLTVESLIHLINELRTGSSSNTLTVGTANLNKLAPLYVKTIEITDEMRAEDDLIDEKLPCVLCESTDEGAMTIDEYTTSKNWAIK